MQLKILLITEIKFFLRNARTRKLFLGFLACLFYGCIFFYLNNIDLEIVKYLMIMTMVAVLPLTYSLLFYSWQLYFLPTYFLSPINWLAYFGARVLLIIFMTLISSIVPLIYFWNTSYLPFVLAFCFYLLPTIPLAALLKGTAGARKIDPNKAGMFANFTGVTIYNYLSEFFLLGVPLVVYGLQIYYSGSAWINIYFMVVGIIALLFLPIKLLQLSRSKNWQYKLNLIN
ncbi:DUF5687 family protein [Flavihumibacter sp. UBA7668]|uniref:DUF5687 family protein n=1 Tax=Flavihumibacter sp. UBA7668 TaxID=1946542 RepID=UPI0025BC599F|nr:DUF5687 family protein [Flavihumibacter sp. UBA7668]